MRLIALIAALCLGCSESITAADPAEVTCAASELDRPQAVAWMGDHLVVASSGYGDPWRAGRVTVFDSVGQVVASRPTAWLNPQSLHVDGDRLLVLSSGAFDLATDVPRMETAGGVEALDADLTAQWTAPLPPLDAGGPVGIAAHADRAVIGSGIRAAAFVLDTQAGRWIRDAADPVRYGDGVGLGAPVRYGDRTLIVDYNADRLAVIGADDTAWQCTWPLAEPGSNQLAGAKAPLVVDDALYYLLDNAGLLMRVDLGALPATDPGADCPPLDREALWVTGQLPSHLGADAGRLFVVQSGDNNVVALDRDSFEPVARYALPPGSNPWHVAVHPQTGRLAVTEWLANAVAIIDPADGAIRRIRCGDDAEPAPTPTRPRPEGVAGATEIGSAPSAGDGPFKDPVAAVNGVQGGGDQAGSQDVYSISLDPGDHLVLCFDGHALDGPGADLVVFENPFDSGAMRFMDPTIVEVSPDGDAWVAFPHDYTAPDETVYQPDPQYWQGFAGVTPVRLDEEGAATDPFDTAFAGGDVFDFASLPGVVGDAVREVGARCVRLTGAAAVVNPDTGALYPKDPVSNGPDIDGVYGRRVE